MFTAPVSKSGTATPTPCRGAGQPLPGPGTVTVSNGETNANGAALAKLIAFLRDSYGVSQLHIVGHSDGGLWSRAALTQSSGYPGVTVSSLTTLGTPHTGSYMADLAIELEGGKCDFSNKDEQRICEALALVADVVVAKLGPTATYELTNDFLATWNPMQAIGNCPVSVIAGDHLGFGIPFLEYYTPSDGLVGLASAQAQEALDIDGHLIPAPSIPGLREAGVYDVVHGASLKFLSSKNLLNQAQISEQVADKTLISGAEPCNPPAAATRPAAESGAAATGSVQRLRAPLYRMVVANRRGRLPRPGPEDFAVSEPGVKVRCGFAESRPIPLLGDRRLRLHEGRGCERGLRARARGGKGSAGALLLRSHPRRHALVRVEGDEARIRIRGKQPKTLKASVDDGSGWRALRVGRKGRAELPDADAGAVNLRLVVRGRAHGAPADTAHLTIAR